MGKMREFSKKNVDVTTDVDCTDKILDFTSKIVFFYQRKG